MEKIRIRILEEIQSSGEVREKLENGILLLWVAANWGADAHPNLWTAVSEARKLLQIEEQPPKEEEN